MQLLKTVLPVILILCVCGMVLAQLYDRVAHNPLQTFYSETGTVTKYDIDTNVPGGATMVTALIDGQLVLVGDARVNAGVANDGVYIIHQNQSNRDAAYTTTYNEYNDYFEITLEADPLNALRREAESELQQILGIPEELMCLLAYSVTVDESVRTAYAGQELRFSFCPGSVEL